MKILTGSSLSGFIFLFKRFKKNFLLDLRPVHSFIIIVLMLLCGSNVNGQEDTTVVNTFIVKKKSKTTGTDGRMIIYDLPPGNCTISGSSTVTGGSTTDYFLSCDEGEVADYWEVICGVPVGGGGTSVVIQWNSSGCTTGTIRARKDGGVILATKTVTILPPPTPTITYTPLYTSSNFTKTIDLTKPVGIVAGSAGTTSSGGVSYSIPIYTSLGTNGLQPSVGITYNSQASAGSWLGMEHFRLIGYQPYWKKYLS